MQELSRYPTSTRLKEGDSVPKVTWTVLRNNSIEEIHSEDIFSGRTVVVVGIPGAFTPICSSRHIPAYIRFANLFRKNGVDEILCVSVNDPYIMNEWTYKLQAAGKVTMIPDSTTEFTRGMGQLFSHEKLGIRSWRYSMLVKDSIIQKLFQEDHVEGDPFERSDAETMLKYLNPTIELPPKVSFFGRPDCPHCARARAFLHRESIPFEEITLDKEVTTWSLLAISGQDRTPACFVGGKFIGDENALMEHFKKTRATK